MTVQELLMLPSLKGLELIAGRSGIGNEVSTVSVMDAPDIYKWMKGGEFLITTAYSIKGDATYLDVLLEKLFHAGVAAFGVKFSRFWGEVPATAINTADRLGLPLIFIPDRFAFTDIIDPVLYDIVNRQAEELMQKERIHKAFLNVVLKSSDAQSILNILSELVGVCTAFESLQFQQIITNTGGEDFGEKLQQELDTERRRTWASYRVSNGETSYGMLFLDRDPEDLLSVNHRTAIEYAGILLALNTQSRISQRQVEERYRNEFFSDLIHNNIRSRRELDTRAALYGWSFSSGGVIVIVDINDIKKQYLEQEFHKVGSIEELVDRISIIALKGLSAEFTDVHYYKQSDFIIYLIPLAEERKRELEKKLLEAFPMLQKQVGEETAASITVGVGTYQEEILDIGRSYQDARFMVTLAQQMGMKNNVFFYEHMSTFHLLSAIRDPVIKAGFIQKYLSPVLQYDRRHKSELLRTIQESVWSGWNLKAAAEALYIHYNTMKYRMGKIEELLDLDLTAHENRLNIELALALYMMDRSRLE